MNIEVSNGEIFDKITILSLKIKHIKDNNKLVIVQKEYDMLIDKIKSFDQTPALNNLYNDLQSENSILWDVESLLRKKEIDKIFDSEFIDLARSVYIHNDLRAEIKRKINEETNSDICEVKEYVKY